LTFGACSSTKKTTAGTSTGSSTTTQSAAIPASLKSSSSAKDGSDFEKAIVIDKKSEGPGIAEEYKWLKENYPGYTLITQSLQQKDKRYFDVMKIKTKDGDEKNIYFDITNFFGKF